MREGPETAGDENDRLDQVGDEGWNDQNGDQSGQGKKSENERTLIQQAASQ